MGTMRRTCKVVIICLVAQFLLACRAYAPTPCEDMQIPGARQLLLEYHEDPTLVGPHIKESFPLAASSVSVSGPSYGEYVIAWNTDNRVFRIDSFVEPRLVIQWRDNSPTLGRVLDCLGSPSFYQAESLPNTYGPTSFNLLLWYESSGLIVTAVHFNEFQDFDAGHKIGKIVYVSGETRQEKLQGHGIVGLFPVIGSMRSVKAWPGTLKGIIVGNDPWSP